jgi:hypothetical protein
MQRLMALAVLLAVGGLVGVARADDKANATGTWKWTVEFGGQQREQTVKLKQEGDKLTGTMPGRDGQETAIEDGKVKDGEVSFKVTRERQGQKFTIKYKGKLTGDTIKGKIEFDRGGETQSMDWEAKRSKS